MAKDTPHERLPVGVKRLLQLLGLFVAIHFMLPLAAGAQSSASVLTHGNVILILLAVTLQAASLAAYAQSARVLLPVENRLGLLGVLRVQLSMLAVSHLVPGGAAASTPLGYRLFRRSDVGASEASFVLGVQGIGSAAVLNVLLWLVLLGSVPFRGFRPAYVVAMLLGGVVIAVFAILVVSMSRGSQPLTRAARLIARRTRLLPEQELTHFLAELTQRFRDLVSEPRIGLSAAGWAAAQWLLDCASLWVFLAAFGARAAPDNLFVAFGIANLLALVPVTPGSLGIFEAALTSALVTFGLAHAAVVVGVLAYRLAEFWLPIPIGAIGYLSFSIDRPVPDPGRDPGLKPLPG